VFPYGSAVIYPGYDVNTSPPNRRQAGHTLMPQPRIPGPEDDRNRGRVTDDEVIRPRAHGVAVALEERVGEKVLSASQDLVCCPEP
jgi:hypothetical protein